MYSIENANFDNIMYITTPIGFLNSKTNHWTTCYSPAWDVVTTINWPTSQIVARPIMRAKEVIDIMKSATYQWDTTTCPFYLFLMQAQS